MKYCTKRRCPMQVGSVPENCYIEKCPYLTLPAEEYRDGVTMTVKELWEATYDYPEVLIYYDSGKNEQDKITDATEMDLFIKENAEKKIIEWHISFEDKFLWMDF